MRTRVLYLLPAALMLAACQPSQDQIAAAIEATRAAEAAESASALEKASKPAATEPSLAPSPTKTPVPVQPTATAEPTRKAGPMSLSDDFSTDQEIWTDCDQCVIEDGVMRMGPFPLSAAYVQQWAICDPCGQVTNYRMAVDAKYVDGPSERGYGFTVRLSEDTLITMEITPWQTLDVYQYDYETSEWTWVNGEWAGAVKPGEQVNRIEIEAATNANGKVDYALKVNGKTPLVIFNQKAEAGWVGLTLFGHGLEVIFDNFEFETTDTPSYD